MLNHILTAEHGKRTENRFSENDIDGSLVAAKIVGAEDIMLLNNGCLHCTVLLQLLSDHQLFVKLSKCSFGLDEVEYLDHTVSGQGVTMDKHKVHAFLEWQTPANVKQLRGLLGLTGYYRRNPPALTRSVAIKEGGDDAVNAQLITREHILIQLQQNLHKAQQLMKNQADKKRKHVTLEIGDLALFKLQPYRQVTVSSRQNQKLVLSF
ncbi:hypothetical protein KIW84_023156 [Lathyrus oleraceus]|uniref:Polyprotein n=1 Tax=Pisum sativum TaxID=3888 RepID=A0A9D4YGQ1_PEA|nr:hypothetical protein KIW84_023156 [Pisum sativum]